MEMHCMRHGHELAPRTSPHVITSCQYYECITGKNGGVNEAVRGLSVAQSTVVQRLLLCIGEAQELPGNAKNARTCYRAST